MRAIDLYAGMGGWSLGLKLAGIDVIASYEWWSPAVETHNQNLGVDDAVTDIRKMDFNALPDNIDLVVGSPPCTEFSYANRGGRGDVAEGMKDLVRFFEVVAHLKPKYWVMENVPRVAEVLRHGLTTPGHPLHKFHHLNANVAVIDFSTFGVPQARKRCIAGNIPFDLLGTYSAKLKAPTLGGVVNALRAQGDIVDPVWGVRLPSSSLTEMEIEPPLNREELRMNREAKEFHPVYNNMSFPDRLDEPARTVTATCTRVSRESIVIEDPAIDDPDVTRFRRLTVRERACLQGFPITYQLYAKSFSEKAKMAGNAIPPPFTYLIGQAAKGVKAKDLPSFSAVGANLTLPEKAAQVTAPDSEGRTYPVGRKFRAAIPHLRFKSGMRFDLSNDTKDEASSWAVRFFFGPSKDIREVELDADLFSELKKSPLVAKALHELQSQSRHLEQWLWASSPTMVQQVWSRRARKGPGPYEVTDKLGALADALHSALSRHLTEADMDVLKKYVVAIASDGVDEKKLPGADKLGRNATRVMSGFVVGAWFNSLIWHEGRRAAA